jgi:hypothetical protein
MIKAVRGGWWLDGWMKRTEEEEEEDKEELVGVVREVGC